MKEYECCWCDVKTFREEEGVYIFKHEDAVMCAECFDDPEIRIYIDSKEEIGTTSPIYPVVYLNSFDDVLEVLKRSYEGEGIAILGNKGLCNMCIDMLQHIIKRTPMHKRIHKDL